MERSLTVMDLQDWCCGNGHPTRNNLQIQSNSQQNYNTILYRHCKSNLQFHIETQKIQERQNNPKQWKKNSKYHVLYFKLYYKVAVIIAYDCKKHRQVEQWNRIEDPHISPHSYSHFIYDKEANKTMTTMAKRRPQHFQSMVLLRLDSYM